MTKEKEKREFELEMLRVQSEHQDILSVLTLFIAILFSAMVSLAMTYTNFFFMSGDLNWAYSVIAILVMFSVAIFLTVRYYLGRRSANLQNELQKIRERFIDKKPVEKNETEENEKKKSMSKYEKLVVIVSVISLLLTLCNIYLIYETSQMRKESLEFQSMMYNFTSVIVARADFAILDKPSSYSSYDNVTIQTTHYGYLDVELQIITPHYGKVSIRCKYFNVGESSLLDQEKRNQTSVSFVSESDKYDYLVISGLNQFSDQLHLKAWVYLNPDSISPETQSVQFPIGRLFLEAEFFDIQTNTTLTKEFSAVIVVVYEPPP